MRHSQARGWSDLGSRDDLDGDLTAAAQDVCDGDSLHGPTAVRAVGEDLERVGFCDCG